MKPFKPRVQVKATGRFRSNPQAFQAADEGVKHALKFEFPDKASGRATTPGKRASDPSTDKFLLDLSAVDPSSFNPARVVRDCEIIRRIAQKHPDKLEHLLKFFQADTKRTPEKIAKAYADLDAIGLTEEQAVVAKGGLLWLLVIAGGALLLGGCVKKDQPPLKHPLGKPSPGPSSQPSTGPSSQPGSSPLEQ